MFCWHRFNSLVQQWNFLAESVLVQTLLQCPYSPMCNHMHQHLCACEISQAMAAIPLFRHTKTQLTQDQPLKMECGFPSGREIQNGYIHSASPGKWVYYLHKEKNAEENKMMTQHQPEVQCYSKIVVFYFPMPGVLSAAQFSSTVEPLFCWWLFFCVCVRTLGEGSTIFLFFISGDQLVHTISTFWGARISPQWLSECPNVRLQVACGLVSQHGQPTLDFVGSRVYACLSVTHHLHFWQNDQSLTCQCSSIGVEQTLNKSQHRKLTLEKKILLDYFFFFLRPR